MMGLDISVSDIKSIVEVASFPALVYAIISQHITLRLFGYRLTQAEKTLDKHSTKFEQLRGGADNGRG